MKNGLASLVVGFIFAIGLGLSGMTQPQKIVGFLNVFGAWDPSLLFVMLGAISIHVVTYRLIRKRSSPMFSTHWHVPTKRDLTPALLLGAFLFGVGWAMGGFCPGPALVSLATFEAKPILFVVSMIFGMYLVKSLDQKIKIRK